ncbi:hypothetical protein ABG067_002684 [Albugo candida]
MDKLYSEAGEPDYVDSAKTDAEMRKRKMDFTLTDAGSQIFRLRNQIHRVLNQQGLQEYVEHADAKRIVQWMVDAGAANFQTKNRGKAGNGRSQDKEEESLSDV